MPDENNNINWEVKMIYNTYCPVLYKVKGYFVKKLLINVNVSIQFSEIKNSDIGPL